MAQSNSPIIELRDVSRSYASGEGAVQAVKGVSVAIEGRSFTAIVGPSGSGKSTLLNLIAALDRPTSGHIEVTGQDLGAMGDTERTRFRRTKIGFVFQFFNLLPTLTAIENVALPADLAGHSGKANHKRARALLESVGLESRAKHRPDELSGGEMQRVAIARALMMDPPLIVADEPTGNLDSKTGAAVLELLRSSLAQNRTVLLVTHDPHVAAQADRVLTMKDGRMSEGQA